MNSLEKLNEIKEKYKDDNGLQRRLNIIEEDLKLREKIEVLEKKLVFYKDFFQRCKKTSIYNPVDNSMHTIIDMKLDDSKIIFGEE